MGYACPVCDHPQHDAEHLANHLAVTALTHGDAHESWLDEHAPGWVDQTPGSLGDRVAAHAEHVDHETVFEDTTGSPAQAPTGVPTPAPDTEAAREALATARRMREEVRGDDGDGGEPDETDETAGGDAEGA